MSIKEARKQARAIDHQGNEIDLVETKVEFLKAQIKIIEDGVTHPDASAINNIPAVEDLVERVKEERQKRIDDDNETADILKKLIKKQEKEIEKAERQLKASMLYLVSQRTTIYIKNMMILS